MSALKKKETCPSEITFLPDRHVINELLSAQILVTERQRAVLLSLLNPEAFDLQFSKLAEQGIVGNYILHSELYIAVQKINSLLSEDSQLEQVLYDSVLRFLDSFLSFAQIIEQKDLSKQELATISMLFIDVGILVFRVISSSEGSRNRLVELDQIDLSLGRVKAMLDYYVL